MEAVYELFLRTAAVLSAPRYIIKVSGVSQFRLTVLLNIFDNKCLDISYFIFIFSDVCVTLRTDLCCRLKVFAIFQLKTYLSIVTYSGGLLLMSRDYHTANICNITLNYLFFMFEKHL